MGNSHAEVKRYPPPEIETNVRTNVPLFLVNPCYIGYSTQPEPFVRLWHYCHKKTPKGGPISAKPLEVRHKFEHMDGPAAAAAATATNDRDTVQT